MSDLFDSMGSVSTACSDSEVDFEAHKSICGKSRNVVLERIPCKATASRIVSHLVRLGFSASWTELWIPRDRGSGLNKGHVFIRFPDAKTAADFLTQAHVTCLDGAAQDLVVAYAPFDGAFPRVPHKGAGYGPVILHRDDLAA
jgi:hypothetical protein